MDLDFSKPISYFIYYFYSALYKIINFNKIILINNFVECRRERFLPAPLPPAEIVSDLIPIELMTTSSSSMNCYCRA